MTAHRLRDEIVLVGMALLMAISMRFSYAERLAVEHFDEGVYTSGLWYPDLLEDGYPARQFFAPPGIPTAINLLARVFPEDLAPFLPGMVLGSLMVVVAWLTARLWFGQLAGIIAAFLVAGSDYHIVFSRTALTDVPALLWITAAVGTGSWAVHRNSLRWMLVAGLLTGIAWFTKYTGWLAVAILVSGTGLWWLTIGRRVVSIGSMFKLLAVLLATVSVSWLLLNWWLQPVGGYSAVAENHSSYWTGLDHWLERLNEHRLFHDHFDSLLACGCLGLGMVGAALRRWIELKRCVWTASKESGEAQPEFPGSTVLFRLVGGALALTFLASVVGSFLVLMCVAVGGIVGMLLWPVLSDLHARRVTADLAAEDEQSLGCCEADLHAAPSVDPKYGACLVVVWFCGLLYAVPAYQPYPRLSLPLLAAIWMGGSAGLAWWMEATLNVARRNPNPNQRPSFPQRVIQRLTVTGIVVAIALAYGGGGNLRAPQIWQDRTSLRDASWQLADIIRQDQAGTWVRPKIDIHRTESGLITPSAEPEYDEEGALIPAPGELFERLQTVATPADRSKPVFEDERPTCVVYGFGEPSVLKHLTDAGLMVNPVQTVDFGPARLQGEALPTYFVMGPYALRSPGQEENTSFLNDWVWVQDRFERVGEVHFLVSDVVLFNLFPVSWIGQHPESMVQKIELYRVK